MVGRALAAPASRDSLRAPDVASTAAVADSTLPDRLALVHSIGEGAGGGPRLLEPSAVTVDAFGRVTIADAGSHRLVRYEADGRWIDEAGALGSDPGQLRRPVALATLGSLGVAVLDRENRRIVSYDLLGRLLGTVVDFANADLENQVGRVDAVAMAADRGGALWLAEGDRDRVLAFDFSGRYLRAIGGYGTRPGSFRGIAGIACDPRGGLAVAERTGARLQRFDAGGRVTGAWPLPVKGARARLPVAVDDSLRIAVADERSGTLWLFDARGRLRAQRTDLAAPSGLAFAPDGTLLVAEGGAARVRRFRLEAARVAPAERGD